MCKVSMQATQKTMFVRIKWVGKILVGRSRPMLMVYIVSRKVPFKVSSMQMS